MNMTRMSQPKTREIIEHFAKAIRVAKEDSTRFPGKFNINFRNEPQNNKLRDVYTVPIDLLRYRKDNGRISSDVLSYESRINKLDETSEDDQKILEGFLREKDKKKTAELKNLILKHGQREPAIITSDGFLVNGNRRKMVHHILRDDEHKSEFDRMEVVILPGENDDREGKPTIKEIEQVENRYQSQSDGRSDFGNFDEALKRRKNMEENGMSLEEQLRDDPNNASLSKKEFQKVLKKYKKDYLEPLECVDEYLNVLGRDECYDTISSQINDPDGRWQAFIDYSPVKKKMNTHKGRIDLGIEEDEVGKVNDVAFKIIRFRKFSGRKLHAIMRKFSECLKDNSAKNEILKLYNSIKDLDDEEKLDGNGQETSFDEQDNRWRKKNQTNMHRYVEQALKDTERKKEMEDPITLLEAAYKKLTHDKMILGNMSPTDFKKAMHLAGKVKNKADELESEFFKWKKKMDKIPTKNKKK